MRKAPPKTRARGQFVSARRHRIGNERRTHLDSKRHIVHNIGLFVFDSGADSPDVRSLSLQMKARSPTPDLTHVAENDS